MPPRRCSKDMTACYTAERRLVSLYLSVGSLSTSCKSIADANIISSLFPDGGSRKSYRIQLTMKSRWSLSCSPRRKCQSCCHEHSDIQNMFPLPPSLSRDDQSQLSKKRRYGEMSGLMKDIITMVDSNLVFEMVKENLDQVIVKE